MSDLPEEPMDHQDLRELCAAHALAALDPPESARMEAHLRAGCDDCEAEIAGHRRAAGALGAVLEPKAPPAGAEPALWERIGAPDRRRRAAVPAGTARSTLGRWLLPAAALLVAGASLSVAVDARRLAASLVNENLVLHRLLDRVNKVQILEVSGLGGFAASGLAFLDPGDTPEPDDDRCSLHLGRLPPPPEGKTYEGWAIVEGTLYDLGTFAPDESEFGYTTGQVAPADRVEMVQVTIEPAGGVRSPTGRPVHRGEREVDPAPATGPAPESDAGREDGTGREDGPASGADPGAG